MRVSFLYIFISIFIIACSGETEEINEEPTPQQPHGIQFNNFDEKISYCIGFDNGFTLSQVYNGPNTKGKFSIDDIEVGMLDYLGDGELRIEIIAIDSTLNLYLGENGEVDESYVSKSDASYAIGLVEAQTLVGSLVGRGIDQSMEIDFLLMGIKDGIHGRQNTISLNDARNEVSKYYSDMNKALGQSFLTENAKNEGIIVTESGLQYEIIKEGTGIKPYITDTCIVHYTGRFIDGRVFESTIPSAIPTQFAPIAVIPGWQEGLLLMKEGGSRRFFIPYELAYGETGSGPVEPYSTLVFDIELIKVNRFQQ